MLLVWLHFLRLPCLCVVYFFQLFRLTRSGKNTSRHWALGIRIHPMPNAQCPMPISLLFISLGCSPCIPTSHLTCTIHCDARPNTRRVVSPVWGDARIDHTGVTQNSRSIDAVTDCPRLCSDNLRRPTRADGPSGVYVGRRRPLLGLVEPFQSLDLERLLLDDCRHLLHLLFGRPAKGKVTPCVH